MTNVQIRDVPESVVANLKKRAAGRGQSLQGYLRDLLVAEAAVQVNNEIFDRAARRTGKYQATEGESAEEVRRAREERGQLLDDAG
jgi:antitoxin FitA